MQFQNTQKLSNLRMWTKSKYKKVFKVNFQFDYLQDSDSSHILRRPQILRNLHLTFDLCSASQNKGGDFCGLLRIYELYLQADNSLSKGCLTMTNLIGCSCCKKVFNFEVESGGATALAKSFAWMNLLFSNFS